MAEVDRFVDGWPFGFSAFARHLGDGAANAPRPGAAGRSKLEALFRHYLSAGGFPAVAPMGEETLPGGIVQVVPAGRWAPRRG